MNTVSEEFNKQLELDVLLNGLTEVTANYVDNFAADKLTDVIIPEGVKRIGVKAFMCCKGLRSVVIPDSVTTVGEYAFSRCKKLISVTLGNGVIHIKDCAFAWCENLPSITIPDNVTKLGDDVFWDCYSLTDITFKGKTIDEICSMPYYPWGLFGLRHYVKCIGVQVS